MMVVVVNMMGIMMMVMMVCGCVCCCVIITVCLTLKMTNNFWFGQLPMFDGAFESCESGDYTGIFFKFKIEYWIHKKGEGGAAITV